jgi:dienelactone hydrolase
MKRAAVRLIVAGIWIWPVASSAPAGPPEETADEMISRYLRQKAETIENEPPGHLLSAEAWDAQRPRLREEYLYMLGLWPLPERTPLQATVTGTLEGEGYTVEMLHYQSRPGLYVTANLYRPPVVEPGERLPAVLYVCGHANLGRDGNKAIYQSFGIWFARHGYICLTLDTLQLGEIGAIHHGTYREQRWWWHSRGYTPAGVECWNGVRGIDYLVSRPDVDPERIAVTGISGGGAATLWITAADERVRVAVPVSGMADLRCYVGDRLVDGHCDCMFMYNTFRWPWIQIAALVAPRPMLFANSDNDRIFPMDANERIINGLDRFYSLFGASDLLHCVVSVGGHAYRQDLRQATYRFINTYLKDDPRMVTDSEIDLVLERSDRTTFPIHPARLRVFPTDADLPADQLNTVIDQHFVPVARVELPGPGQYESWKGGLLAELHRVSFTNLPERQPEARVVQPLGGSAGIARLSGEDGTGFRLRARGGPLPTEPDRVLLAVTLEDEPADPAWLEGIAGPSDLVFICQPRGVGETRWTRTNPPNTVERSFALLGQTADAGRVRDVIAAARTAARHAGSAELCVAGQGAAGVIAAYAALFEADIKAAVVVEPPTSHMDSGAPQFLNVLRVCDIPDALGLLAPRPLTLIGADDPAFERTAAIYAAAGAERFFQRSSR